MLLPVDLSIECGTIHFYVSSCGRHMSARMVTGNKVGHFGDFFILFAFHQGKFDKFKQNFSTIFTRLEGEAVPLIIPGRYRLLPPDILNSIQWRKDDDANVPQGVIKIRLGRLFDRIAVPLYTQT